MIKNDKWILEQAQKGMITYFEPTSIRKAVLGTEEGLGQYPIPVLSWGVSSYGYDIRLSPHDFRIFRHIPGTVVDPKKFNPNNLERAELHRDKDGSSYFIMPANTYALGASIEGFKMPDNAIAICVGKSTYARSGIIICCTPIEPGFIADSITLEFSNASSADVKVYANEGIGQLLFFEGDPCETTYSDRNGKYQNQGRGVTLPIV